MKNLLLRDGVNKSLNRYFTIALITVFALSISACEKKEQKPGQVIAKVNGQDITIHQLNQELARAPGANEKQILELLISRQLVVDAAINNKLDRDPSVVQAIERTKSEILTQAYLKNKINTIAKPTKTEIDAFYNKHPEFFGLRKLFETKEVILAKKDSTEEFKKFLDSANSAEEIASWLEKNKIKYVPRQLSRTTMDIPLELASKWQVLHRGDKIVMADGNYITVAFINEVKDSPVSAEAAIPQIEQYLRNTKAKSIEQSEITQLRKNAKIEYLNSSYTPAAKDMIAPAPTAAPAEKQSQDKPY